MFFAYGPTQGLTLGNAAFVFAVSTFAFIFAYSGRNWCMALCSDSMFIIIWNQQPGWNGFALLSHTFTNLVYLLFGAIALIILPLVE